MAKGNFARALAAVLVHEGGWADHPQDPGGATNRGVTLATYRQYRPGASKADLRNISQQELEMIYRSGYWNKVRGDDLPAGVDLAVFDFAVNSGPSRAAKYLQALVGVPQDGKIGPVTLAAVAERDAAPLVEALCERRLEFLKGLSHWNTFRKGWTRRVHEVLELALLMAVSPAPPQPDIDHHEPPKAPLPYDLPDEHETPASEPRKGSAAAWLVVATLFAAAVAALAHFTNII